MARLIEEGASAVYQAASAVKYIPFVDVKTLHTKFGGLTSETDALGLARPHWGYGPRFDGRCARQGKSVAERKAMIE